MDTGLPLAFSSWKVCSDACWEFSWQNPSNIYIMGGVALTISNEEKDLDVLIDSKLNFDRHIGVKVNKANSLVGLMQRSFEYIDPHVFKQLFKSIVRPHLEYATPVWNPHLKKHISSVENVQRRATRMVPGLKGMSYKWAAITSTRSSHFAV